MGQNTDSFMQQIGQTAGGGILGIGMQAIGNQLQLKQQKKLMEAQAGQQKGLMDYQNMKQMEMWRNTSYGPQVEQMKMAGINPALMYGMSGGGGQTAGGGMPGGGGAHAEGAGNIMGMGMTSAQLGLLKAQRENIEADTANKKADVPVKGAQVPNIQADTKGKELSNTLAEKTMKDRIDQVTTEALTAIENLNQEITQTGLDRATVLQKAAIIKTEAAGKILQNILTSAQTGNVRQDTVNKIQQVVESNIKIKMWIQENMIKWDQLSLQQRETAVQELIGDTIAEQAVWNNILGGLDKIMKMLPAGGAVKSIKGFKF